MLFETVLGLFVLTQVVYFVANLAMVLFIFRHRPPEPTLRKVTVESEIDGETEVLAPVELVSDSLPQTSEPVVEDDDWPAVHVLVPIFREDPAVLLETLENIFTQEYPMEHIHAHVIYEQDDESVPGTLAAIADWSDDTINVWTLGVNHDQLALDQSRGSWAFAETGNNRTKAAALTYAFSVIPFQTHDIITVFDSDTLVPSDTFSLAIGMLQEYDIVQAKQTVRNLDDGVLPMLEAMGIASWTDIVYARTANGPYQLLGKAYFIEAGKLYDIGKWDVDAATEDMSLGLAAFNAGYELGVLDRYIQDTCPSRYRDWVKQKRRWVRGPYEHLDTATWSLRRRLEFWTATIANQAISLTNVIGLPLGLFIFWMTLFGDLSDVHPGVWVLVSVNAIAWVGYTIKSYQAALTAIEFENNRQKLRFFLVSNPLTQAVYAALWAVPIALAIWDHLSGKVPTFEVTPKS